MQTKYISVRFKKGYPNVVDAEDAYNALEKIRQKNGVLTAELVVEQAKRKSHPLHDEIFREDDTEAAYQFRLDRARGLIRAIKVIKEDIPEIEERAYQVIKVPERGRIYQDTVEVLSDPITREQLLERAKMDITRTIKKYKSLLTLADLVAIVKQVFSEVA